MTAKEVSVFLTGLGISNCYNSVANTVTVKNVKSLTASQKSEINRIIDQVEELEEEIIITSSKLV